MDTFYASGEIVDFPKETAPYRVLLVSVEGDVAAATPVNEKNVFTMEFEWTEELRKWVDARAPFVFVVCGADGYESVAMHKEMEGPTFHPLETNWKECYLVPDSYPVPKGDGLDLGELIAQVGGIGRDMGKIGSDVITQVVNIGSTVASLGDVLASRGYLSLGDSGSEVALLHGKLGKQGASGYGSDANSMYFGQMTREAVEKFQRDRGLPVTGAVDRVTWAELEIGSKDRTVSGRAVYQNGLPATGKLKFVPRSDIAAGTPTDVTISQNGVFRWVVTNESVREVRIYLDEIELTTPISLTDKHTCVDVVIPQEKGNSEYNYVYNALGALTNPNVLASIAANPQNAALLGKKHSVDARLVGYALSAAPLVIPKAQEGKYGMSAPAAYAIARCGFPTVAETLAHIVTGTKAEAEAAYKKGDAPKTIADAIVWGFKMGVIGPGDQYSLEVQLNEDLKIFEASACEERSEKVMPGSVSSLNGLLSKIGMLPNDIGLLKDFLFGRSKALRIEDVGLTPGGLNSYKVYSHLAAITRDNANLIDAVVEKLSPGKNYAFLLAGEGGLTAKLVDPGKFDLPKTWTDLFLAAPSQSPIRIPDVFFVEGETFDTAGPEQMEDARAAYAQEMARKVAADANTLVLVRKIRDGIVKMPPLKDAPGRTVRKELLANYLTNAANGNFKLGYPIGFAHDTPGLLPAGTDEADKAAVIEAVKTTIRLYAVSPSDSALSILMDRGFSSAQDIADMEESAFVSRYVDKNPNLANEAKLIYQRARQVADFAHMKVLDFRIGAATPPLVAIKSLATSEEQSGTLMTSYPNMKQLFGSTDFAEVPEHRSVLGPAAYFVDLLHFLDPSDGQKGSGVSPYEVLTGPTRRPDLPSLELSHENAFTMLPHIDIVNEILEQLAGNGQLRAPAHNTDPGVDVKTEPQNVDFDAYSDLYKAVYPLDLPFDHAHVVRNAILGRYGISPAYATEMLLNGESSDDFAKRTAAARLGMSFQEFTRLTTPYVTSGFGWFEFFGYPSSPALAVDRTKEVNELTLWSAQVMANRLGVTYLELARIVTTSFVNAQLEDDPNATATVDFSKTALRRFDGVTLKLTSLNSNDAMKINFFTRIWRRLGCSIEQLDQALATILTSVANGLSLSSADELASGLTKSLVVLGGVVEAARRLEVDWKANLHELLTLFYRMPTGNGQILYRRLFQQPAVKQLDKENKLTSGDGLSLEMIQVALRLSSTDFGDLKPENTFTAEQLGDIVSEVFHARFAGLSLGEWRIAREMLDLGTGMPALTATKTIEETCERVADMLEFIDQGQRLARSGLTVADLTTLNTPVMPGEPLNTAIERATPPEGSTLREPHLDGCSDCMPKKFCDCPPEDKRIAMRVVVEEVTKQRTAATELVTALRNEVFSFETFEQTGWEPAQAYDRLNRLLWLAERAGLTLPGFKTLQFELTPKYVVAYLAARNRLRLSDAAMTDKLMAPTAPSIASDCAKVELGMSGIPLDTLKEWVAKDTPAETILNGFRRLQTDKSWPAVGKAVMDPLRKKRRDALLSYVLLKRYKDAFTADNGGTLRIETPEELYNQLLIDPRAEPAVLTSRLVLATASVQQFVQRCLMNLESPSVQPETISKDQWKWMKRYRVWEAARKMMLYPENWLEPSIRDDKTPAFKTFESEVLGDETDEVAAERAFTGYVRELEQIARLEIVATYLEEKPGSDAENDVLHVLGRTSAMPHKYLYRKLVDEAWTPWEQISVEPQGDHVTLAVWKGRPHVLWVTFLVEDVVKDGINSKTFKDVAEKSAINDVKPTNKNVSVQLNWSEYSAGGWSAVQSTKMEMVRKVYKDVLESTLVSVQATDEALTVALGGLLQCEITLTGGKDAKLEPMSVGEYAGFVYNILFGMEPTKGWDNLGPYSGTFRFGGIDSPAGLITAESKLLASAGGRASVLLPSNRHEDNMHEIAKMAPVFYSDDSGVFLVQVERRPIQATCDALAGLRAATARTVPPAEVDAKSDMPKPVVRYTRWKN